MPESRSISRLEKARLYGILDLGYVEIDAAERVAAELLAGGVDLLQLRGKGKSRDVILELGSRLKPLCLGADVPLIINDHPEIALELEADGLHIGQDDGNYEDVRRQVGERMILGRSTHSPDQAAIALEDGFDYIGFGPLFPTPTKAGRPGIGLTELARVQDTVGSEIPVFCIGGIKRSNLSQVLKAGAKRVVIVSDLLSADSVRSATSDVVTSLQGRV